MHKNMKFEIVRGAASILLALAVAMIFIFIISCLLYTSPSPGD